MLLSYDLVPPAFPPHSKRAKEAAEGGECLDNLEMQQQQSL